MYWAVYLGGPRWDSDAKSCYSGCHITAVQQRAVFDPKKVVDVRKWIEESDPDISEIEKRLDTLAAVPKPHSGKGNEENLNALYSELEQLIKQ
jgi:hypothetical protein